MQTDLNDQPADLSRPAQRKHGLIDRLRFLPALMFICVGLVPVYIGAKMRITTAYLEPEVYSYYRSVDEFPTVLSLAIAGVACIACGICIWLRHNSAAGVLIILGLAILVIWMQPVIH